ncbi:MAG TPA: heme ABC exporter ATP-binding protein CcmA [Thermohalobaculum sp.]|nr:heme ABC exporter ATP-binding protein CcmA [Thermohalobaculum sp.]
MALVLDNLACRRGGRLIYRGLAFRVAAGEAAAVKGPNAVGKSTLLRQLAGLIPLAGGDARLGELSLARDRGGFQERAAYAGHADAVKPALTVAENLAVWAGLHGSAAGRVGAALERFGLAPIAARPAAECSAGQKRRLGLARLMLIDRPLWLMDEPTVSLDADAVRLVAGLVREHIAAGGLALIATHAELGLGDIPVLEMTPPEAVAHREADPFLAGAWP